MGELENLHTVDASSAHADPVAAARQLLPLIRAHADETERGRKLAAPVVEVLRSSGLFAMGVPAALGGLETPIVQVLRAVEEISYADGATGWNVMIAFDTGLMAGYLHAPQSRELIASIPLPIIAGSVSPPGRMQRTEGGYRLTGRWRFGSGCQQADVFILAAVLFGGEEPIIGANGIPEMLEVAVPAADVDILDTWRVAGLRGTGSHDFTIHNLFVADGFARPLNFDVPFDRGPLYAFPMLASFAVAKGGGRARRRPPCDRGSQGPRAGEDPYRPDQLVARAAGASDRRRPCRGDRALGSRFSASNRRRALADPHNWQPGHATATRAGTARGGGRCATRRAGGGSDVQRWWGDSHLRIERA